MYDAFVDVSTPANRGRISGLGVGVGYVGSFIGLGIGVVTLDVLGWSYAATFLVLALAFLVLALPSFFFIDERVVMTTRHSRPYGTSEKAGRLMAVGQRLRRRSPVPGRPVLYTDAINTLIGGFLTIFVIQELGLDGQFTTRLLGVAIASAIVGAFAPAAGGEIRADPRVARRARAVDGGDRSRDRRRGDGRDRPGLGHRAAGGSPPGRPGPRIVW